MRSIQAATLRVLGKTANARHGSAYDLEGGDGMNVAQKPRKKPGKEATMNALDLLKQDHEKVKELFKQFEANDDQSASQGIVDNIKTELQTHAHVEESIFYPTLEDQNDEELIELVDESLEEHQEVKDLLKDIESSTADGEQLKTKVMELRQKVEHHATEEETEMFPLVRRVLQSEDLERMGDEIESEKQRYSPEMEEED
jgi:iron-sulfur cluster repair protein YtfE (RIC family)